LRWSFVAAVSLSTALQADASQVPGNDSTAGQAPKGRLAVDRTACEGNRSPLPYALTYSLREAAFPGGGGSDVAVHVPPGFDATRKPGVVVYFHGWQGCVAASLSDADIACTDGGDARRAGGLAAQIDDAGVNALLVAVELRVDLASGEPGRMAMPAGLRGLLRELFAEHLADLLGCTVDVDALDRVVVIAHSGGYQAAASVLEFGDMPQISEVDLLDSLYGAGDVFTAWVRHGLDVFDPRASGRRFVDLYTCCGETVGNSRALAKVARGAAEATGWRQALFDDDSEDELERGALEHAIVFKRVPRSHAELPRAYVRVLVEAAGFARRQP
jgi:hypothetical protein